jgi:hypothetical protein
MNRFWIGVGLLLALLGAGFWSMFAMDRIHRSIVEDLHQSAEAAQAENWEEADALAQDATVQWEKSWRFTSAMADHTELDEIDSIFSQTRVYRQDRRSTDYAATCARLAKLIEALEESHKLSWWNLL